MVTVNNYYNNIPVGRDLNNLPNTSSAGTTVGYQYDGLTEEDRFVQKVLQMCIRDRMTVTFEDSVKVESISKGMNVING